ncbi:hypothetical protein KJ853_03270 [Patescibacteria group bacterium]|nr:hypothetical protein [Patescibacteria group bacterium]
MRKLQVFIHRSKNYRQCDLLKEFTFRAWRKICHKIEMSQAYKNRVLWWGPDRQVGALRIAILARPVRFENYLTGRGESDFIKFLRLRGAFSGSLLCPQKRTKLFMAAIYLPSARQ